LMARKFFVNFSLFFVLVFWSFDNYVLKN